MTYHVLYLSLALVFFVNLTFVPLMVSSTKTMLLASDMHKGTFSYNNRAIASRIVAKRKGLRAKP